MSGTSRRTVYVGLFVFIATLIFCGAILAVGSLQNAFSPKTEVHAVFAGVDGLQTGDSVWSSGMRVGVVSEMVFIQAAKVDVTMKLNTELLEYIPADSLATIGSDGLIGNPIVVLDGGTPDGPGVTAGALLGIGEAVSTTEIMETLQENNKNLIAITTDIKALTAGLSQGEGTLGRLLKEDSLYTEVETALADVAAASADVKAASAKAKTLVGSLSRFTAQLEKPGQLPYELVHDDELMPSARATLAELQSTAAKAAKVVDGLASDVDNPSSPLGVMMSDSESGTDLKQTLANLEEATTLLNEDLKAVQSNFLFRPYFKKQERLERKAEKQAEKDAKKN